MKRLKVIEADKIDIYHYHGSFFEYSWRILTNEGLKELSTFSNYSKEDLINKIIEITDDKFIKSKNELDELVKLITHVKNNILVNCKSTCERKEEVNKLNLEFDKKRYDKIKVEMNKLGLEIEGKSMKEVLSELVGKWKQMIS